MALKKCYIKISPDLRKGALREKLLSLMSEKETMREVHEKFREFVEKYVPHKNGNLREDVQVTPSGVIYKAKHARYQYGGEVYGPNLPVAIDGAPAWRSRKKKHPTGRMMGSVRGILKIRPVRVFENGSWRRGRKTDPELSYEFGYTDPITRYRWDELALEGTGKRRFSQQATYVMKKRAKRLRKKW